MSDITYTRITPAGEEKCSLRNGEGMTIEEMEKAVNKYCDNFDLCGDGEGCILRDERGRCRFVNKGASVCYNILVNAGLINPPLNFVKANPDDEVESEGDAVSGLADSGTRREFASGAVRDVAEGKGRCDLLPLDVVALLDGNGNEVLYSVHLFTESGNTDYLQGAIHSFCTERSWGMATMLLEVAKHFEAGAKKYSPNNWRLGIPAHCYIDSGVRHYLKWLRGDTDEPHDRAFCWNMLCCIWTCKHLPELNDLPWAKEVNNDH